MGTDFGCGCRASGGAWYLCKKHENNLFHKLETECPKCEGALKEIIRTDKKRDQVYIFSKCNDCGYVEE